MPAHRDAQACPPCWREISQCKKRDHGTTTKGTAARIRALPSELRGLCRLIAGAALVFDMIGRFAMFAAAV
jgi:hypothetical protein